MSIYHDVILDHYQNPRNFGVLENPDIIVTETNASCGDEVEIQLQVTSLRLELRPRGDKRQVRVNGIKWRGRGCAISMAGASLLSERLHATGYTRQAIENLTDQRMIEMLGGEISSARMRCATLALTALRKAVSAK